MIGNSGGALPLLVQLSLFSETPGKKLYNQVSFYELLIYVGPD